MCPLLKYILLLSVLLTAEHVTCQTLTFTECAAKLPTRMAGAALVYDGEDSIYIMGGYSEDHEYVVPDVLKYSISTDQIANVGELPVGHYAGCGFRNVDGSLVYAGGYNSNAVYGTGTATGNWSQFGTLPAVNGYSGCIVNDPIGESATLFGGWFADDLVVKLDLADGVSTRAGQLSEACKVASAVYDPVTQNATIFCSVATYWEGKILNYHVPTGATSRLLYYPRTFFHSSATFDGVSAYIIGGWSTDEINLPPWGDEILVYNTQTQNAIRVSVANIPSANNSLFDLTSSTYVPKLNRIYIFGGRTNLFSYLNTIWYMDLNPVNPPNPDKPNL